MEKHSCSTQVLQNIQTKKNKRQTYKYLAFDGCYHYYQLQTLSPVNLYLCKHIAQHTFHILANHKLFPFSAPIPLVGWQKWLVDGGDNLTGALHYLLSTTSIILSSNKIQNGDTVVSTNLGVSGKCALKWRDRERERERSNHKLGRFSKLCGRLPQYAPAPCKLTIDITCDVGYPCPILVFLGLSVLQLDPMYATVRRQTATSTSLNILLYWIIISVVHKETITKVMEEKSQRSSSVQQYTIKFTLYSSLTLNTSQLITVSKLYWT